MRGVSVLCNNMLLILLEASNNLPLALAALDWGLALSRLDSDRESEESVPA